MHQFFGFGLACLLVASPAFSQSKPPVRPMVLAEHERVVEGGRAVLVELPQSEIDIEVDIGRVVSDAAYGGGLLGALFLSSSDRKRKALTELDIERARHHVAPLRDAIKDFDFENLAIASAGSAFSRLDWFGAREQKLVRSQSDSEREAFAKATGARQLATVTYRYSLSPDCTQLRVVADIALWRSETTSVKGARGALAPLYQQRIAVIAELRVRSYEHSENVAQWSADNGKLARASIRAALTRLEQLIPFAFGLTQADIDALNEPKSDRIFAAGFYGPPVRAFPDVPGERLIWRQSLIYVMPAPEARATAGAAQAR